MNRYVIVLWPESQELMQEDWFNECILVPCEYKDDWLQSSAYFVPEDRYIEADKYSIGSSLIFYVDNQGIVIEVENPS
jgi:hypothetical protein